MRRPVPVSSASIYLILVLAIVHPCLMGQNRTEAAEFEVKEHYTKYEFRIPMRDGVHLFTSVYVPKDG